MKYVYVNAGKSIALISDANVPKSQIEALNLTEIKVTDSDDIQKLSEPNATDKYIWSGSGFELDLDPVSELKKKLITVCDWKQRYLLNTLLNEKNTPAQLQRYERKYERAKLGVFSTTENSAIIEAHESFLESVDTYTDMIELARMSIDKVIDIGDLEHAESLINKISELDETVTLDQVNALLLVE